MRWILLSGLVGFLATGPTISNDGPRQVKPVLVWTGINTKQPTEGFARCCSQEEWKATWNSHSVRDKDQGDSTCPAIDFDAYMVLAVFQDSSRLCLAEVLEENDCLRVRYRRYGNQIIFIPDPDGTVKVIECGRGEIERDKPRTLGFVFVLLPRSNKAILFEDDVQNLIGGPPVWQVREKLPALTRN
jgi:hypothetical protein